MDSLFSVELKCQEGEKVYLRQHGDIIPEGNKDDSELKKFYHIYNKKTDLLKPYPKQQVRNQIDDNLTNVYRTGFSKHQ